MLLFGKHRNDNDDQYEERKSENGRGSEGVAISGKSDRSENIGLRAKRSMYLACAVRVLDIDRSSR